ncbi:DnaD domain protein [Paraliobacillus ryukyuensis]|uniref:DnaD domain protein n=1 Tax=Paraliobacillus ryukyuensis TaxID=200904 RepID=UPI0009A6646D|nr:DnaD domain protein [Paraliobacillus ryukyuensis]
MTKDAFYFSHDSNAHKDPKILKLRAKFGWEGYGIYWAIIETLREQTDYKWKASDKQLLSFCFANGEGVVNQVIDECLEIGLLVEEDDYIHSESLTRRMKMKDDISEKRRAAGKKGGLSKSKANAKQNASNKRKEIKESKGKKVNDVSEESEPSQAIIYWEDNIGTPSPSIVEKIIDWEKDLPSDVVAKAIEQAVVNDKRNWSYINKILSNWNQKGVKTLVDAENAINNFERNKVAQFKPRADQQEDTRDYGF